MPYQVSLATAKNWKRLGTSSFGKLTSRANKIQSKKHILPLEYFTDIKNAERIKEVITYIQNNKIQTFTAIYSIAANQLRCANILHFKNVQHLLNEYH